MESAVLPVSRQAPAQARQFVRRALCAGHATSALSAVVLAASEMATQAVRSGEGPLTVTLACRTTAVTLSVTYPTESAWHDERLRLADDVAARIIDGISRDSGTDVVGGKQRVWCTIPTGFVPVLPPFQQRSRR